MSTDKKTSVLVDSLLPGFLETEGPQFQAFIKAYYEWMEQNGQMTDVSKNLLNYQDLDETADEYLKYFKREILSDFPDDILTDKKLVYKKIKDLYRSKGTEQSYNLLFRILYDEDIEIYYPGQDILRASDGRWVQETSIRLTKPFTGTPETLASTITGNTSEASAKVERVQRITSNGVDVYEVFISDISGDFIDGETITNVENTFSGTVISEQGSLQRVIILDGGSGHRKNDVLTITSSSGTGGRGIVNVTSNSSIVSLTVSNTGSSFNRSDPVTIVNTTRAAANATGAPLVTVPVAYTGRYNDVKGFLSWSNKLQDNFFYQEYSYVIKSEKTLDTYKEIVNSVVHPSGTKLFGEFRFDIVIDSINNLVPTIARENILYIGSAFANTFIPTVVSSDIEQYERSEDLGAISDYPEVEIELVESMPVDVRVDINNAGYQLEIQLIAAQTSALLDADEIISVNLQRIVEDVTINEAISVDELVINRVWNAAIPTSNTELYANNGGLWFNANGVYLDTETYSDFTFDDVVTKGLATFNLGISLTPTITPTAILSTQTGFDDIELEMFIDPIAIDNTQYGTPSLHFAFDAFSEITDSTIPLSEYTIEDFANALIEPNYTDMPINEEITIPNLSIVSIDASVIPLAYATSIESTQTGFEDIQLDTFIDLSSIITTVAVSNVEIDMFVGGASLISISSTESFEANNEMYIQGSGTVSTIYVDNISDVENTVIGDIDGATIDSLSGTRRWIEGISTQFLTETSNTNLVMIRDTSNTGAFVYNQIQYVDDANTLFLTSNVDITITNGDIFYRN